MSSNSNPNNSNQSIFERIIQSLANQQQQQQQTGNDNDNDDEENDNDQTTNDDNNNSTSQSSSSSSSSSLLNDLMMGSMIGRGGAIRLSNNKITQLLQQLSPEAGMGNNYDAASELCHFLSMSNEQTLSQVGRIGELVPPLVRLMQSDENYDLARMYLDDSSLYLYLSIPCICIY